MNVASELNSIKRTRKIVNSAVWVIAGGAILFSLMTGAPLVSEHSEWRWTGWVLPALVDAALVLSLSADAVLSRYGIKGGRWPTGFRWITGLASLFLNTWGSYSTGDRVGVAIHSIAPVILICTSEVAPIYRRKFRDLELELTGQVTELKVTKVVSARKVQSSPENRSQVTSSEVTGSQVTKAEVTPVEVTSSLENELTENQRAIRDGYLNQRKAADVAKEIGVSPSYVSRQYKKIRQELELTA
ncbi:hypothetical protein ACH3XX_07115 [Streptomyces scabiei]|uniref:hypothetical protein n=1 Tax=Streptomyces scabiei TaxID=1930 RepID=UPI0037BA6525